MDDLNAFERQVAGEFVRRAGPVRPVDAAAIFTAITATQSPKRRFQTMFSAAKVAVAGAIVALFGGFLLSGVLTQQPSDDRLPAVGASASATTQVEPTDAATSEPEPTTEAEPDDTTTPDLLPGVDLVTEKVEPGVYRVVSDGLRNLSEGVQDVTVTSGGEVWVELGKEKDWDIVRLGEPGVSRELGGKDPWLLFTLDGVPAVSDGPGPIWRVFDGDGWIDYRPTGCDEAHNGWFGGGIAADGRCWLTVGANPAGIVRVREGGRRDPVTPEEIGIGLDDIFVSNGVVADDGALWATVRSRGDYSRFSDLVRYDGSTWELVRYEPSIDGLSHSVSTRQLALDPGGTVWVVDMHDIPGSSGQLLFGARKWDGDEWTAYGPVEAEHQSVDAPLYFGNLDARFLDDGRVWLLEGLLVVDADGLRSQELPGVGDLTFGPDGFAWTVADGGLYVITPEAVAADE